MARHRQRLTLESGPKLDLASLIRRGKGRPGCHFHMVTTYDRGEVIRSEIVIGEFEGRLNVISWGHHQSFALTSDPRPFGGRQWYILCPVTKRRVRVLFRPLGATKFASRHAWGSRRAAYASQFLNPVDRAWRTKAKMKARLLGDADPDEWDLPPKPKWMRLRTYSKWEGRFDRAEDVLDQQCALTVWRLLKNRG